MRVALDIGGKGNGRTVYLSIDDGMEAAALRRKRHLLEGRFRHLPRLAIAIGEMEIGNIQFRHAGERHACTAFRFRLRHGCGISEHPVTPALAIRFKEDIRALDGDAADIKTVGDERQQRNLERELFRREHLRLRAPGRIGETDILRNDRRHERKADMQWTFNLQYPACRLPGSGFDLRSKTAKIDQGQRIKRAREKQNDDENDSEKFSHGSQAPPAAAPMARSRPGQMASTAGASSAKPESTQCAPAERSRWGS